MKAALLTLTFIVSACTACAAEPVVTVEALAEAAIGGGEDLDFDARGTLYTGTASGDIIAVHPDGSPEHIFSTDGRPLGIRVLDKDTLLVADAARGLVKVCTCGEMEVVIENTPGNPLLCNGVALTADRQTAYFTSSSSKFPLRQIAQSALTGDKSGRLYRFDPKTNTATKLLDGLHFPNGVAVLSDGSIAIAETFAYRVLRYQPGDAKPTVLIDNLPGFPDNLSVGSDGRLYIALYDKKNTALDIVRGLPGIRDLAAGVVPKETAQSGVGMFAVWHEGKLTVHHLGEGDAAWAPVTSVVERNGNLYLGSTLEDGIGVVREGTKALRHKGTK